MGDSSGQQEWDKDWKMWTKWLSWVSLDLKIGIRLLSHLLPRDSVSQCSLLHPLGYFWTLWKQFIEKITRHRIIFSTATPVIYHYSWPFFPSNRKFFWVPPNFFLNQTSYWHCFRVKPINKRKCQTSIRRLLLNRYELYLNQKICFFYKLKPFWSKYVFDHIFWD